MTDEMCDRTQSYSEVFSCTSFNITNLVPLSKTTEICVVQYRPHTELIEVKICPNVIDIKYEEHHKDKD